MSASRTKLSLGFMLLAFFSIAGPFRQGLLHFQLPPFFSILPAPPLQSTEYPPPETPVDTTSAGYPGPATATTGALATATPVLGGATLPLASASPGLPSVTPSQTLTPGGDIFLTENAEMGQSRATPLPTETPSPSATLTDTPTPVPPTPTAPPDEGFAMNWGVFLIAFVGMVVLGGAAWLAFLKRLFFRNI
jgi:hypothetical protein